MPPPKRKALSSSQSSGLGTRKISEFFSKAVKQEALSSSSPLSQSTSAFQRRVFGSQTQDVNSHAPSSSQPQSSTPAKRSKAGMRKPVGSSMPAPSNVSLIAVRIKRESSLVERENEPPIVAAKRQTRATQKKKADPEVISIDSRSEPATHISITSSTNDPSVISISSSSIAEILPPSSSSDVQYQGMRTRASTFAKPSTSSSAKQPRYSTGTSNAEVSYMLKASPCVSKCAITVDTSGSSRRVEEPSDVAEDLLNAPFDLKEGMEMTDSLLPAPRASGPHSQKLPAKRKSSSSRSPSKKLKVNHFGTSHRDDQEVPTSQSDEKELLAPLPSNEEPEDFRRKVVDWQKSTQSDTSVSRSPSPSQEQVSNVPFDDHLALPQLATSPLSSLSATPAHKRSHTPIEHPSPSPFRSRETLVHSTPKLSDIPSLTSASSRTKVETPKSSISVSKGKQFPSTINILPPSPPSENASSSIPDAVMLDEKSKTAALIASIRDQCYNSSVRGTSPDELDEYGNKKYGELKPLGDSDGDDDDVDDSFLAFTRGRKLTAATSTRDGKDVNSSSRESSPSPSALGSSRLPYGGRSLRSRTLRSASGTTTRSRISLASLASSSKKPPKKRSAPFAAILKQRTQNVHLPLNLDLTYRTPSPPSTPNASRARSSDYDDQMMDEDDRMRLLGEKDGERVGMIIESDRAMALANGADGDSADDVVWRRFWNDVEEIMDADVMIPRFDDINEDPALQLLKKYTVEQNEMGINSLLQSGVLHHPSLTWTPTLLHWLFCATVLCNEPRVFRSTQRTLKWKGENGVQSETEGKLHLSLVLFIVASLGADTTSWGTLNWEVPEFTPVRLSTEERGDAVARLVEVVGTFSRGQLVEPEDVPGIVTTLLAIALDPTCDESLRLRIECTVEELCCAFVDDGSSCEMIIDISLEILRLCEPFNLATKTHFLTMLHGGTVSTRKIAQWVAYGMLMGSDTDIQDSAPEFDVPPLKSIIDMLTPARQGDSTASSQSSTLFQICKDEDDMDSTDYGSLSWNVEILSDVLTNIPLYVQFEKTQKEADNLGNNPPPLSQLTATPEKKTSGKSELHRIIKLLKNIENKITDTRAAHLDRSRAKAALQRLGLRIHHQRLAALNRGNGSLGVKAKARKLDAWFDVQPSPKRVGKL